jgi:hypothetical protein
MRRSICFAVGADTTHEEISEFDALPVLDEAAGIA